MPSEAVRGHQVSSCCHIVLRLVLLGNEGLIADGRGVVGSIVRHSSYENRKRGERGEGRRRKDKAIDEAEEDYRPRAETVWWCSGCVNGANVRRTERKRGGEVLSLSLTKICSKIIAPL